MSYLRRKLMASDSNVVMEGVRIIFRNFEGKEGPYNKAGERNFAVVLDETVANAMAEDGWNVKWLKPREDSEDEGEEETPYLPVSIRYDVFPPHIVLVTSRNRTILNEEQVEMLDYSDIINVDLIVRPYQWIVNNKTGIKAYVKTMFVTIEEDQLVRKYAEMDAE
jgi:hypothetical protein